VLGELCAARDTLRSLNKLPVASLNTKIYFDTFIDFFPRMHKTMTGKTGYKWKTADTWNMHVTRDCCKAFVKCEGNFDAVWYTAYSE
jgi:hypothetical protein